jgi:hypothetical protein
VVFYHILPIVVAEANLGSHVESSRLRRRMRRIFGSSRLRRRMEESAVWTRHVTHVTPHESVKIMLRLRFTPSDVIRISLNSRVSFGSLISLNIFVRLFLYFFCNV